MWGIRSAHLWSRAGAGSRRPGHPAGLCCCPSFAHCCCRLLPLPSHQQRLPHQRHAQAAGAAVRPRRPRAPGHVRRAAAPAAPARAPGRRPARCTAATPGAPARLHAPTSQTISPWRNACLPISHPCTSSSLLPAMIAMTQVSLKSAMHAWTAAGADAWQVSRLTCACMHACMQAGAGT